MTREEQIAALIAPPPGYAVDLFGGMLSVHRIHATVIEAAKEFERVRRLRQLGYEFETAAPDRAKAAPDGRPRARKAVPSKRARARRKP